MLLEIIAFLTNRLANLFINIICSLISLTVDSVLSTLTIVIDRCHIEIVITDTGHVTKTAASILRTQLDDLPLTRVVIRNSLLLRLSPILLSKVQTTLLDHLTIELFSS